jgi:hypothetical protein
MRGHSPVEKSGTVCVTTGGSRWEANTQMGFFRLVMVVYVLVFALMVVIAIGSFFGAFSNPLIDPGM